MTKCLFNKLNGKEISLWCQLEFSSHRIFTNHCCLSRHHSSVSTLCPFSITFPLSSCTQLSNLTHFTHYASPSKLVYHLDRPFAFQFLEALLFRSQMSPKILLFLEVEILEGNLILDVLTSHLHVLLGDRPCHWATGVTLTTHLSGAHCSQHPCFLFCHRLSRFPSSALLLAVSALDPTSHRLESLKPWTNINMFSFKQTISDIVSYQMPSWLKQLSKIHSFPLLLFVFLLLFAYFFHLKNSCLF